jgi:hypothetical protein
LLLTVSLLALAFLVAPAMSVLPKKILVDFTHVAKSTTPPPEHWTTGNAGHGTGGTIIFTGWSITGDGVDLTGGDLFQISKYNVNLENGRGAKQWKVVIDFGGGTFEGHINVRGIFDIRPSGWARLIDGTSHAVLQGAGEYQGWILVWTRYKIGGVNQPYEAYMLMP